MLHFRSNKMGISEIFARKASSFAGSTAAFVIAASLIIIWGILGPILDYSEIWQLSINTTTTIVTFLMVFLIQRAQNKDSMALHIKLNELVATIEGASNRLIDVEDLSEEEIATLATYFQKLAEMAKKDGNLQSSHTIEEAQELHKYKSENWKKRISREKPKNTGSDSPT